MSDSATPWNAACHASLSITNSQSLLKLMSIESVMPSNHLILCRPLFLPPSIFPSIRVFSMSLFIATGGQATGASVSASVLPVIFGTDFLQDWLVWFPCIPRDSQESSAAAKSLQSCLTLCDPIEGSPLGSSVPRILQARILEWVTISFSNAWKWKVKVKSLSYALSDPMDCSLPGSSIHGIFQARVTGVGCHCLLHKSLLQHHN